MFDINLANDILTLATDCGADFAEIFAEHNAKNALSIINGKVDKASGGIDCGMGLRLFKGERVIYIYTNDMERDSLLKMTKEAASGCGEKTCETVRIINADKCETPHLAQISPEKADKKYLAQKLKTAAEAAEKYSPLVTQTSVGYSDSVQDVFIANSEGLCKTDRRIRSRVAVSAVASSNTEKQTGYFGPGALKGTELLDELDLAAIGTEAARCAVTMLKADNCPCGVMPVIIDNGFGGVIFHEACGHGLEAAAVSKNASVFANKVGQQIASPLITAIDDGSIKNQWGSIYIDDEGEYGRKNILIENGILKGYMTDRYNGARMGAKATGSSRRQSYRYVPTSRMTNTYIDAGKSSPEEIIAATEYGLYAKYMGGGSVNPATGEFNFAVSEAYIVKNGKICEPVRGATLIGKGSEVLMDIDMVGNNLRLAEGMCGASSGSVPVCVGQPMLRVKKITVGGR
ncbi:MAG: TldD/PmbA family protein [Firmicutes bacterium]|nr:TldD/PmbA family protein [Bacillota bacterium]